MTPFWIGFGIGLVLGCCVCIMALSLVAAAKHGDWR